MRKVTIIRAIHVAAGCASFTLVTSLFGVAGPLQCGLDVAMGMILGMGVVDRERESSRETGG